MEINIVLSEDKLQLFDILESLRNMTAKVFNAIFSETFASKINFRKIFKIDNNYPLKSRVSSFKLSLFPSKEPRKSFKP